VATPAASAVLARELEPHIAGQAPLLPFTLAVIASAWYGGLIAGLGATILSFLIADYLFIDPRFQFLPLSAAHLALFLLFLVVGLSISILKAALGRNMIVLKTTIKGLDEATQRYELAAQHGRIGFQDYFATSDRQIWTPEMEQLFGLAPGTFEGSYADWVKRIHPEDRERVARGRLSCIERQQSDWTYEYRAVLPDGSIRWLEGRSRLFFSESGSLERILGATIDITERRQLEQSLSERSEELSKANQELDRFAYIVSHDLQEPLRGITVMIELLLHRSATSLDPKSAELLGFVVKNAERMRHLIEDILDLARVGTGLPAATSDVDVAAALQTAIEELAAAVNDSHARITFDPMPTIRANESQLVRLFRNLLGNAIKYHGDEPPEIHVAASSRGNEWTFCVSDNGIGIDREYHQRIFGAFQRLHSTSEYKGTGLGLTICQRIVQRHNGRLWVESEPKRGARFYVALPKEARLGTVDEAGVHGGHQKPMQRSHTAG
jgi:PAS domain S-box-containing protein